MAIRETRIVRRRAAASSSKLSRTSDQVSESHVRSKLSASAAVMVRGAAASACPGSMRDSGARYGHTLVMSVRL